jgi:hypothetical protein
MKIVEPKWEGKKFDMMKIDSENAAAVTNALCQGFEPFAVCTLPMRSSTFANEMIVKIFIFFKREAPSAKNTVG